MKVGITGTQIGVSKKRMDYVYWYLRLFAPEEFHHGDCVGVDKDSHLIAIGLHIPVFIHPPKDPKKRAWCQNWAKMFSEKPYIDRNHDNVDAVDILLVLPKTMEEELRSGTWATYRYAKKIGVPTIIL